MKGILGLEKSNYEDLTQMSQLTELMGIYDFFADISCVRSHPMS